MGRTACTEPQCLYKGELYVFVYPFYLGYHRVTINMSSITFVTARRPSTVVDDEISDYSDL